MVPKKIGCAAGSGVELAGHADDDEHYVYAVAL
jgi:hypothetical protein